MNEPTISISLKRFLRFRLQGEWRNPMGSRVIMETPAGAGRALL
jgi:hypothetical protein